ncbi:ribonuclease H-like domain-containing protein [Tanacetum coccineum]
MRPFGCLVTTLNTIDHLGKFDGKADEGFFVGYSLNSKAFRVFNSRTMIVEENLHIRFSENTPNVVGSGPDWLFDIDALTRTMNYEPIVAGTQSNGFAGTKASDNAGKTRKETEPVDEDSRKDSEGIDQEKEDNVNSTNNVNAASTNEVNVIGGKTSIELLLDPNMSELEDCNIFDLSRDDEDDGAETDMNNLDTTIQKSEDCKTPMELKSLCKGYEEMVNEVDVHMCACLDIKYTAKCFTFFMLMKKIFSAKKQTVVANSITEAEYVAASSCCGQVLWIQNQLLDYGQRLMLIILAERLQAQEQEELSIKEKAILFPQLLEKRRKHFAAKRAEDKRNKSPTKAQHRKIMCTYLKNMEGYKLNDLKRCSMDESTRLQSLFLSVEMEAAYDLLVEYYFLRMQHRADLYVGREEVSSYTIYTYNDVGKEAYD